jgi:hypothetical protein
MNALPKTSPKRSRRPSTFITPTSHSGQGSCRALSKTDATLFGRSSFRYICLASYCSADNTPRKTQQHPTPHPTALHRTTPHHIAPHHSTLHSTAPHCTAPHCNAPHHTTPNRTALHRTAPHHTTQYRATPNHTEPHHTTPWRRRSSIRTEPPLTLARRNRSRSRSLTECRNPAFPQSWTPVRGRECPTEDLGSVAQWRRPDTSSKPGHKVVLKEEVRFLLMQCSSLLS